MKIKFFNISVNSLVLETYDYEGILKNQDENYRVNSCVKSYAQNENFSKDQKWLCS